MAVAYYLVNISYFEMFHIKDEHNMEMFSNFFIILKLGFHFLFLASHNIFCCLFKTCRGQDTKENKTLLLVLGTESCCLKTIDQYLIPYLIAVQNDKCIYVYIYVHFTL